MKKQRGGKRPGAGRKKGALQRATKPQRDCFADQVKRYAPDAIAALVKVARTGKTESARVAAANSILDRAYGRPPQSLEHTGPGGGPIQHMDLSQLTDEQLAQLESIFGPLADAASNDGADQSGEGSEGAE